MLPRIQRRRVYLKDVGKLNIGSPEKTELVDFLYVFLSVKAGAACAFRHARGLIKGLHYEDCSLYGRVGAQQNFFIGAWRYQRETFGEFQDRTAMEAHRRVSG